MTLLASIHDVAPPHLDAVQALRDDLGAWGADRVTLLVVPDYRGVHPIERAPATVRWLRLRAAAGDEICLHGERHVAAQSIPGRWDRLRAAWLTAGEGECLAQDPAARRRMLEGGKRRLEDLLGTPVRGFVAPAWLEPRGFARDLLAAGFTWHEGTTWIEHLGPAGRRARTPVVGFATRTAARRLAALAWAAALVPALAAAPRAWPVRVALHPTDRRSPAVMRAAARAVGVLALRHTSESYSRALGAAGGRPGSRGATGLSLEPR